MDPVKQPPSDHLFKIGENRCRIRFIRTRRNLGKNNALKRMADSFAYHEISVRFLHLQ